MEQRDPGTCSLSDPANELAALQAGQISFQAPDGQQSRLVVTNDGYITVDDGTLPDARVASIGGFARCDDGTVTYQESSDFWGCVAPDGDSLLLWLEDQGDCTAYRIRAIACT